MSASILTIILLVTSCLIQVKLGVVDSQARLLSHLKSLDANWHSVHAKFEIESRSKTGRKSSSVSVWINSDQTIKRGVLEKSSPSSSGALRRTTKWRLATPRFRFDHTNYQVSDSKFRQTSVGRIAGPNRYIDEVGVLRPAQYFFTADYFTGEKWHQTLAGAKCKIVEVGGGVLELSARGKNEAMYRFRFRCVDDIVRLDSVSCSGARIAPTDLNGQVCGYSYELSGIDYSEIDGRYVIGEIGKVVFKQKKINGETIQTEMSQKASLIETSSVRLTERIEFPGVSLAEGTSVRVVNDRGIPYEIRGGTLVKAIDPDIVEAANGTRFREPEDYGWFYFVGCALLIAISLGILIMWRRK